MRVLSILPSNAQQEGERHIFPNFALLLKWQNLRICTDLFYHVVRRTYWNAPWVRDIRNRQRQVGMAEGQWEFVKKQGVFFARSMLNKGNLHMNMPAQLCCHLLRQRSKCTMGIVGPEEGEDGHSLMASSFLGTNKPSIHQSKALKWRCRLLPAQTV